MVTVELPRVEAKGSRRTVGRQHGAACGPQVRAFRDACLAHFEQFGGLTVDRALRRAEGFLEHVERGLPELADEVHGIADGAGITLAEAALLQVRYEVANFPAAAEGCTLVGVEAGRSEADGPLVAQNIDIPASNVPLLILLHARLDDGPEILTCTLAGVLAQTGINTAGLALCGSFVVSANWRAGIPARNFVRRHILEQRSLESAVDVLRRFPVRASGHNVMLADGSGRVIDIESTPDDFRVLTAEQGVLAHTNHYRHPDLAPVDALDRSSLADFAVDSRRRLARVGTMLGEPGGAIGGGRLQAILRDHEDYPKSICRHPDGDPTETQSACSVLLMPAERQMAVSVGTPCRHSPVQYRL
jgi:predicted choloylglycine hydrolase